MLPPGTKLPVDTPAPDGEDTPSPATVSHRPDRQTQRLGNYELLERIGHGGLGDVHRAWNTAGQPAEVALKVLRGGEDASPAEVRSFRREIEVARRLRHPGILPILDVGD